MEAAAGAVVLASHDVTWARQFADEAALVRVALAVVTSFEALDRISHCLEALRYQPLGEFGIPGRQYFREVSPAGIRTYHLHALALGSADIVSSLASA